MAQKCIAQVDLEQSYQNGAQLVAHVTLLAIDTVTSTNNRSTNCVVSLDATSPATWTAALAAGVLAAGKAAGLASLTAADVKIESFA